MFDVPYGALPYGAFNLDYSKSVADVLEAVLEKPWLERSWLVHFKPRDASTTTDPVTLLDIYFSSDGHRTLPADTVDRQYPEGLEVPYDASFGLGGKIYGEVGVTFSEIVIGDPANLHRHICAEDWSHRDVDVYLGPRGGSEVQFAIVAKLRSLNIRWGRGRLSVMVDVGEQLNRPIQTELYEGTGGLEGGPDLTGVPKPELLGEPGGGQLDPVLVDGTNHIYQLRSGSMEAIDVVYEDGDSTVWSFNADVADITAGAPGAGNYDTSLAAGFFRLGGEPAGKITVKARGHNGSTYGYVDDAAGLLKLVLTEYAGLIDPDNFDTAAFATLAIHTASMGVYIRSAPRRVEYKSEPDIVESVSILSVIEVIHRSAYSWGHLRANKVYTCGRIGDPSLATSEFAISAAKGEVREEPFEVVPFGTETYRVLVGYARYHSTIDVSDVTSAIGQTDTADLNKEYRFAKATATADEQTQMSNPAELTVLTNLVDLTDAQALADELLLLYKVQRYLVTISPRTGLIKRGVGTTFELTDDSLPDSPAQMTIVDVPANRFDDTIEWVCFK